MSLIKRFLQSSRPARQATDTPMEAHPNFWMYL